MMRSRADAGMGADALPPGFAVAVGVLAFATFAVVTAEFGVVGLLPAMAADLGVSLAEAGAYVTVFALGAAVLGPPLTMLATRCAPRAALVATALVFAAGNLAVALASGHGSSHGIVIAVRLAQGCVLPAFVSIGIAAAARLAGAGREGWAMSLVNTGVVAATVLGIPAGAWVAEAVGWPAAFAGLAGLGLVSAGLIAALFPPMDAARPASPLGEVALLKRAAFLATLLLAAILFAAMFAGYTYIAAFLGAGAGAGLGGQAVGWVLMGFGAAGVAGNWLAGRVVDRDPLAATAAVAAVLALAMAAAGPLASNLALLVLPIAAWGAAHTAAFVFCQTSTVAAAREAPAFAMSLNISVCNAGIALGALAGGSAVDRYGVGAVGYTGAALAAVALMIGLIMLAARSARS